MNIIIRNEIETDIQAISEITRAAFADLQISNHTEQFIINALRDADALTISLVAEADNKVAGHIAFSPVTISDGSLDWYGLGPISVLPELQKRGIGKSLIHEGLSSLKGLGAKGCVLVGDPGYYERFGFRNPTDLSVDGVPQQYFLALPFGENKSRGTVLFHESFAATS
ncbi:MAG: N-acetyltransferase [Desulfobacterales bacterium]|nr:N-acetyltransferase [Desulfobacterales bacterium]